MKLTKQQIQDLYNFTRKHYVYWYDLQSELVDHLANDIEQIWQKEPQLSFDEAKQKAFKKFGVFGFMDVVEEKQKALSKRYYKLFWNAFKQFFTIPKIALTISLFFVVFNLIKITNYNKIIVLGLPLFIVSFPFFHIYKSAKKMRLKWKQTGKKYMFEEYIANLGGLGVLLQFPFQFLTHYVDKEIWTNKMELGYSITMVLCILVLYVFVYEIPPKVSAILAKEHPEYQILT